MLFAIYRLPQDDGYSETDKQRRSAVSLGWLARNRYDSHPICHHDVLAPPRDAIHSLADELGRAASREEVIWEAADVLYFTLARLAREGIDLAEVERHLDRRGLKVTRRN